MRILVTGAAGFIGMHVTERLLLRGDTVFGLDNLNDYYDVSLKGARLARLGALGPGFRFACLDLAAPGIDWDGLFAREGFDAVIHLAAQAGVRYSLVNPACYIDSNLTGFANILEACRRHSIGHLVFASSSSVYGGNRKLPYREDDAVDHPVSLYAATKRSDELMAHSYSHLYALPTTGLRFFTVYGPWGRPDMAYYKFTRAIVAGESIDVYNHGRMERDFTYIDDIVEGVLRVVDRPATPDPAFDALVPDPARSNAPYRIYNIGGRRPQSLSYFIEALETVIGQKAIKRYLPMQDGDVAATEADTGRLEKDFGFFPETRLEDGLARFVDWYKQFHRLPRTAAPKNAGV